MDGRLYLNGDNYTTVRDATSAEGVDDLGTVLLVRNYYGTTAPSYQIHRVIMLFDTSVIGIGSIITNATIDLFGTAKAEPNAGQATLHIVSSNPVSNTSLAIGDYSSLGTTSYASMADASFSTTGYNIFTLNSSGLSNISKNGISKFGARVSGDLDSLTPGPGNGDSNEKRFSSADVTDTSQDPKLVVTYTLPAKQDVIWFD